MKRCLAVILFFLFQLTSNATLPPPLEREVNLTVSNEPVAAVLQKIQNQTALVFSYQSSVVAKIGPVSLQLKQKTVREALALLFPKDIAYKVRGNYIILKTRPDEANKTKEVSGYVYDKESQKKLPNVTIYDKTTLKSVTTNEYGYYTMTVPKDQQCIKVNKENYKDTCVQFPPAETAQLVNIPMDVQRDSLGRPDTITWRNRVREFGINTKAFFGRYKGYINTVNVRDTFERAFQVSFLPFLGSNGLMSGNVYNDISLNVIGGFSRGTNRFEAASLFNVNRERMKGLQLAGVLNVVGDSATGGQLAGIMNVTGRMMKGVQAAGFVNLNVGELKGVQLAGLFNANIRRVTGLQMAGSFNLNTSDFSGLQTAGVMNLNAADVKGIGLSGMLNVVSGTLQGVLGAGLMNLTWHSEEAVELAGALNVAKRGTNNVQVASMMNSTLKGTTRVQVAALFNYANYVKGFQLGLINVCDSTSGVPIGFLSIVRKGLHQLEVSGDEVIPSNFAFRTGVQAFHTIFSVGAGPGSNSMMWQFGYGAGTSIRLSKNWRVDLSGSAHHISEGTLYTGVSARYIIYSGVEYKLTPYLRLAAGPTVNFYLADALLPDYTSVYSRIGPSAARSRELSNDYILKSWMGFKVALRFF